MSNNALLMILASALVTFGVGCPPPPEGDGDADSDVDADSDADSDVEECDPEADCCADSECSNGIYCDGLEVCDRGVCETGFPIDCDDDLACTEDVCDEMANLCVHAPRHDECDDDDRCNGEERCDPSADDADDAGCSMGSPLICDDLDPCTDDFCEDDECRVSLKDSDEDGYGDDGCAICSDPDDPDTCVRGDDCNDDNELTYPGATEICDDGEDNNCDRVRDYADPACTVPNDACADALALTADVVIHSSLRGTAADIDSSCGAATDRDVAFSFTITEVQDVDIFIDAAGGRDLTVGLTGECGNPALDVRCTTGRDFTQIHRALAAGTYYVVVSADGEADFDIRFSHAAPAARPDGDQCATAPDASAGGSFSGTTTNFDPDYDASCGEVTDRDATFAVTVAETTSMNLSVNAGAETVAVAVQSTCGVPSSELACFEGSPASEWVRHLPPGTHYIIVKAADEVDFTMDIEFLPTSSDECADALDASTPGTYRGSTMGMAATIDTACGSAVGPDSTYMFTLTEERDVTVDFSSPTEETTLSLTSACGDPDAELRCSTGTDFQVRGRGLAAGTYYLVATAQDGGGADFEFDIAIDAPVARPPEDLCTGAIDVTGGGSFSGDTMDAENDYESACGSADDLDVAYAFDLATAQALDLTLTAGTGPVTVAIQPACGVMGTERSCFTTDTSATRHFRSLEAGRYYLVFKTPTADTFDFTVGFGPAEPTLLERYIDPAPHTVHPGSTSTDDGQYDIDIAPLAFPFNGTTYQCFAVSTNGYIRFGPAGACPTASSYSDTATDIEEVYPAGTAQVSWLAADGYSGSEVRYHLDTVGQRVIITYLDYHRLGTYDPQDIQMIFDCDTGDIQLSYVDCNFDTSTDHWSIGTSEPALAGGTLQTHDFPAHTPGSMVGFGPGAVAQAPEHTTAADYLPLAGRAIFFARSGDGWDILVDDLPL